MIRALLSFLFVAGASSAYSEPWTDRLVPALDDKELARPDIVDRNGVLLATDVRSFSLFADPNRVSNPEATVRHLKALIPDLDEKQTLRGLTRDRRFLWIARDIAPSTVASLRKLGLPGLGFVGSRKRVYPLADIASHVIGHVNVDNHGKSGIEAFIDLRDLGRSSTFMSMKPERVSIDARIQKATYDIMRAGMDKYRALAAGAVVLDVKTGEVLALVSLPDFDPNKPMETIDRSTRSDTIRMTTSVFEMGAVFKIFTVAAALSSGVARYETVYDTASAIRIGDLAIRDYRMSRRTIGLPEVFVLPSNTGAALMSYAMGPERFRRYLTEFGLLTAMKTELPYQTPLAWKTWDKVDAMTVGYGHGVATTPLQTAAAVAAILNDGKFIVPTFLLKNPGGPPDVARTVVSAKVSAVMRRLFRMSVVDPRGSGHMADVVGLDVGGRAGTAQKVIRGGYDADGEIFNVFVATLPTSKPRYVILAFLDNPKHGEPGCGRIANCNVVPLVGQFISSNAQFLEIKNVE